MIKSLFNQISEIFNPPEPIKIVDDKLGLVEFRKNDSDDWVFTMKIENYETELHLEGDEASISEVAKNYFLKVKSNLPTLWKETKIFSIEELNKFNFRIQLEDFQLSHISIHPVEMFENGEISFWFSVRGDLDGAYFVPLKNGNPIYLHRDS